MIKMIRKGNLPYTFIALFFALILFFNANGRSMSSPLATTEDFEETATKVQIHPVFDSDKYYIHGFDPYVSVKISSPNRIQLNAEANPDTRRFRVIADLSGLKEGTHDVKLRVQNESSGVNYTIDPGRVTVTVEKRVTQKFAVEASASNSDVGDGFSIDEVTVEPKEVEITTGDKILSTIQRVVATVDPTKNSTKDYDEDVSVRALDAEGNTLSVVADPVKVKVHVKVTAPMKNIGLYVTQTGTAPSGISGYNFQLSETAAELSGAKTKLDQIDSLPIPVDVTGITEKVTKSITVPTESGLSVKPKAITVTITPVKSTRSSDSTQRNSAAADGNDAGQDEGAQQPAANNNNNNAGGNNGQVKPSTPSSTPESQPQPSKEPVVESSAQEQEEVQASEAQNKTN